MSNLTLYRFTLSGHSHRAELFTSLLKLDVNMVDVALQDGAQKHDDFLKMNIFGQVPVLKHNDDVINDSNAILLYLAQKFDANRTWYPEDITVANFEECITLEHYDPINDCINKITFSNSQISDLAAAIKLPEVFYSRSANEK